MSISRQSLQLDGAVKRGARGLKILKDWGLGVKDETGKFVALTTARLGRRKRGENVRAVSRSK